MPNRECVELQVDYDMKKKQHERNALINRNVKKDLIYDVKGLLDAYSKNDANSKRQL